MSDSIEQEPRVDRQNRIPDAWENGKKVYIRGLERQKEKLSKEEAVMVSPVQPIGGGVLANGTKSDSDVVFKREDQKRFSSLVQIIGNAPAPWVAEALEEHGIVLPGGQTITRMAAATEAMFHAAIADKSVPAFVALRDSGWGKPKEELEVTENKPKEILINAEVIQSLRRAKDEGKVIDAEISEGATDAKIVQSDDGSIGVSEIQNNAEN